MPTFDVHAPASDPSARADLLLVPAATPLAGLPARLAPYGPSVVDAVARALAVGDFDAKPSTCLALTVRAGERFPRVVLVGLGAAAEVAPATVRRAFATAARTLPERVASVAVAGLPPLVAGAQATERIAAAVDGLLEGSYRWTLASTAPKRAGRFVFLADRAAALPAFRQGIADGRAIGEATVIAREIGNETANRMSPDDLAERARSIGKAAGLSVKILDEKALARERCEAILTVGAGSARPPRLAVLSYDPGRGGAPVALVGKGLVYDTGGLDIKPNTSMVNMKLDKCGAAAVLGAMSALPALKIPVPVVGVVPAVENSISGTAYRNGDVIGTRAGKTVDVQTTDAEGRLVLADALDWVVEKHSPQAIVDLATLTGAVFYALGDLACAVLGTNAPLVARLRDAGERTGERAWELPLWSEAIQDIESSVADLRNNGPYGAGAIAGAAFLRKFVGDVPWAHLDIAAVSWNRRDTKVGATGFGTRMLLETLRRWPKPRPRARRRAKRR